MMTNGIPTSAGEGGKNPEPQSHHHQHSTRHIHPKSVILVFLACAIIFVLVQSRQACNLQVFVYMDDTEPQQVVGSGMIRQTQQQNQQKTTAPANIDGTTTATTNFHWKEEQPILIPMHKISEGRLPPHVNDRHRDWNYIQEIRQIGYQALIQYGNQIRNFILAYGDLLPFTGYNITSFRSSRNNISVTANNTIINNEFAFFQERLHALTASWLQGNPNDPEWPYNQFPNKALSHQHFQDKQNNNQGNDHYAIVVCAGDRQYAYLETLLYTIRIIHDESTMPIYITYRGNEDLQPTSRQQLYSQFDSLHFIDLTQYIDCTYLKGWDLRMFGLLFLPNPVTTNVLILDADVLLLQPPSVFFQSSSYKLTGAWFFHDRMFPERHWQPRKFLYHIQPQPSSVAIQLLTQDQPKNQYHEHVQESGVLVLDLQRHYKTLWTICLMVGRPDIRRFAQWDLIYGDKEFYWSAFELIHDHQYTFSNYYPGVLGGVVVDFEKSAGGEPKLVVKDDDDNGDNDEKEKASDKLLKEIMLQSSSSQNVSLALCGRLLHFDDNGKPLWSNGGYLTKDDDRKSRHDGGEGLNPVLYVEGGRFDVPGSTSTLGADNNNHKDNNNKNNNNDASPRIQVWKLHPPLGVEGLIPSKDSGGIQLVPPEIRNTAKAAIEHYLMAQSRRRLT